MTVHRIVVDVPRPPMTANQQRAWHWSQQRDAKVVAESLVRVNAKRANLPKLLPPSHVSVTWFAPDKRRRDSDSLGPFVKAALDSLVTYGAWPDDHSGHVLSTSMAIAHAEDGHPRIEIQITEGDA